MKSRITMNVREIEIRARKTMDTNKLEELLRSVDGAEGEDDERFAAKLFIANKIKNPNNPMLNL